MVNTNNVFYHIHVTYLSHTNIHTYIHAYANMCICINARVTTYRYLFCEVYAYIDAHSQELTYTIRHADICIAMHVFIVLCHTF